MLTLIDVRKVGTVVDKRAVYWFGLAEYDLKTAKAMLKTKRYIYVG